MKDRFGMFRRASGNFYARDKVTGKSESLGTSDRVAARQLLAARNQAVAQPQLNRSMAKAYLSAKSPELLTRTWEDVMGTRASACAPAEPILVREVCPKINLTKDSMNKARNLEPERRLLAAQLNIEMGDWVHGLAPCQVISHMTFEWEASVWSAQRCYEKFMRLEMWGVSYFYALEQNPGRDGFHVHALRCDCKGKSRREIWREWFHRYGRARIEPVNNRDDVADYCAKYVTKEGAWWNVKLLSHRNPQTNDNFQLQ